ncbi:MAG: adenylate/guanylate cyclase domain-containing protein [Paracoccaceae bacterium]|nr:MAG: adenylate/guanylate cyclase domain-containing protein [Paracoccaceae bacterium]
MGWPGLDGTLRRAVEAGQERTATAGPGPAALPARVGAEIARREAAAERTIGWAQLVFVLFFSLLYAIAPRAEGGEGQSLVPATLAAYFVFTLFRLILSYRRVLPDWFLMLSILVDVALLCGLIFSFHIQYAQPPAFYLKAPTMIHFFIFISLRALRFDPRFVLLAGLASVAGWMSMVAYALLSDMGKMYVTRNYVEYLTSNAILVGAEIDKAAALLSVTLILSFALYRARSVLMDAIASRSAADDLSQFFAPDVARTITHAEAMPVAGQSEVREAAILFLDVRGFTPTAAGMEPGAVMAVLGRYQQIALDVIGARGGQIDKFLGDGILATFGAVRDSATPAADALLAASTAIAEMDRHAAEFAALGWPGVFRTGAGVAAGSVTAGVVGAAGRLEFTVIGDAVNRAAKFEAANKMLGSRVLTDSATLAAAQAQGFDAGGVVQRTGVRVPGVAAPVDLAVLA